MKQRIKIPFLILLSLIVMVVTLIPKPFSTYAAENLNVQAKSAILLDAETGKILYEKNADLTLPPASMTKMMTEYLVLEAIHNGEISWDTKTQVSDYAYWLSSDPEFSGIGLRQNYDYTVKELYEAMGVFSDNGTTVTLAELVAGTEGKFVQRMREKAKEMGLPNYQFVNATGLSNRDLGSHYPKGTDPEADDLMSARSAAILAYHLIKDFPEALDISSMKSVNFEGTKVNNINWLLPGIQGHSQYGYEGVDGLKTGWTDLAKYCFTGTAQRNGHRLISVVMGAEEKPDRFTETAKLFDYGFSQFETKELFPAGYQIEDKSTIPVIKGKEDSVEIASKDAITSVIKKGEEDKYKVTYQLDENKLTKDGELVAPVKKGEKIGTMILTYTGDSNYGYITDKEGNKKQLVVDVVTQSDVEKANWFVLTFRAIFHFFGDIFSSVANAVKGLF